MHSVRLLPEDGHSLFWTILKPWSNRLLNKEYLQTKAIEMRKSGTDYRAISNFLVKNEIDAETRRGIIKEIQRMESQQEFIPDFSKRNAPSIIDRILSLGCVAAGLYFLIDRPEFRETLILSIGLILFGLVTYTTGITRQAVRFFQ